MFTILNSSVVTEFLSDQKKALILRQRWFPLQNTTCSSSSRVYVHKMRLIKYNLVTTDMYNNVTLKQEKNWVKRHLYKCDFRLQCCTWVLCSYGILQSAERYSVTNISGQPISPNFDGQVVQEEFFFDYLTLQDGTSMLSQNVNNKLPFYTAQNSRRAPILHFTYLPILQLLWRTQCVTGNENDINRTHV